MRYILLLLLTVTLLGAEYLRTIRIGTFPDEDSAKKALKKLEELAEKNSEIAALQKEWDFEFKERKSGNYYITLAEPFRDREVLQTVLDNLRIHYPDIYVTRLKSYSQPAIKQEKERLPDEEKINNNAAVTAGQQTQTLPIKEKPQEAAKKSMQNKTSAAELPRVSEVKKDTPKEELSTTYLVMTALGLLLMVTFFALVMMQRYKKRLEDKQLEVMMLQEKLDQSEQKLKNKDKIFSHTSHELRNPMGAIIGLAHLLLEESMPQKQKDYVKKIEGSAKYLLDIVNDILDISKMEAGALKIENREFNLNHVLRHVINIISVGARENGTKVELDIASNVPPYIVGDSLRLTQILVNLLSNAVKFTKNGIVILAIRKTTQNANTLTLEFSIKDNGIGMTPSQLKHIFNSYAQASESTAREYGGTGLGLSIVKYLVDIMKGDIHVESKKHHGTTFVLHLKFHTYKEKEKRFYRLPSKEYLNRRILIVDKSQSNIKKLTSAFSYFNYIVHTIPTFHETVLDANIRFDIVVVNKALIDEYVLNIVHTMKKEDKTKFILFSDSAYELDKKLLEKLDVDEHLSRPFTQEDVLELLKKICTVSKPSQEDKRKEQADSPKEKLKGLGKRNILVAEDNRLNHKVLQGILFGTGFEITFVEDGEEALAKLQDERVTYDLILLDINMPKLNGYETAMEARKIPKYKETPILALTADVMQDAINKCYEAGMQGHISKPIIINNFYEKLYRLLSNTTAIVLKDEKKGSRKKASKALQEISTVTGLEQAHNDESLYKSLLQDFESMYLHSASELEDLIKRGEFKQAHNKALDIKETALHIGAYKLYESIAALQYEIEKAQQSSALEMLRFYRESLSTLLKEIKAYLN